MSRIRTKIRRESEIAMTDKSLEDRLLVLDNSVETKGSSLIFQGVRLYLFMECAFSYFCEIRVL